MPASWQVKRSKTDWVINENIVSSCRQFELLDSRWRFICGNAVLDKSAVLWDTHTLPLFISFRMESDPTHEQEKAISRRASFEDRLHSAAIVHGVSRQEIWFASLRGSKSAEAAKGSIRLLGPSASLRGQHNIYRSSTLLQTCWKQGLPSCKSFGVYLCRVAPIGEYAGRLFAPQSN